MAMEHRLCRLGCISSLDNNEDATSANGLDNDGDGWLDSEDPACADGGNRNDGLRNGMQRRH